MKPYTTLSFFTIALGLVTGLWAEEPNLVPNGQLVRTDPSATMPDGWEFSEATSTDAAGPSGRRLTFVEGYFQEGGVEIVASSLRRGQCAWLFRRDVQGIVEGRRYRLRFWSRATGMGKHSDGRIVVSDKKDFIRTNFNPLSNWAQISVTFTAKHPPEGPAAVHIGLNGPGRLGIERISLVEEDEIEPGIGIEMIRNGDMERDGNNNGVPDSWRLNPHQNKGRLGSNVGLGGGKCLTLKCDSVKDRHGVMAAQFDMPPFRKNHWYEVSYMLRCNDTLAPRRVRVNLLDAGVYLTTGYYADEIVGYEWSTHGRVFKCGRASDNAALRFGIYDPGLTIEIDNVTVKEVPPGPEVKLGLRVAPLWPDKQGGNLIPNASFEMGSVGWGSWSIPTLALGYVEPPELMCAQIDESTAVHGRRSLVIELDRKNAPTAITDTSVVLGDGKMVFPLENVLVGVEGWYRLKKHHRYVLSVWCKADREGATGRLTLQHARQRREACPDITVPLSTEWKRYTLPFTAKHECAIAVVGLDLSEGEHDRAKMWIDAVQLEQGAEPSKFVARGDCEVSLATEKRGNIFDRGDRLEVIVHAYNDANENVSIPAKLVVTDYWDNVAVERAIDVSVDARQSVRLPIDTGLTRAGFYRAKLYIGDEKNEEPYANLRCAIVERVDNSRFGGQTRTCVDHMYSWPSTLELAKKIGVTQYRLWGPFKWNDIERVKGTYSFADGDALVDRALDLGLAVHGVFEHPSSAWASSAREIDLEAMGPRIVSGRYVNYKRKRALMSRIYKMPRDLDEMAQYTKRVVEHFKGRVTSWEILNEPKGYRMSYPDYSAYLAAAGPAVRSVDPKLPVLGGWDTGPEGHGGYKGIFELGAFPHMSVVSLHSYPGTFPPEGFIASMREFNKMMKQFGDPKPYWYTEFAYWADDDRPYRPPGTTLTTLESERQKEDYMVRVSVLLYLHGTEKIFWHSASHSTLVHGILRHFFEYGNVPRKTYPVMAALSRMIPPDARPVELLANKGVYAGIFKRRDDALAVVWRPGKSVNLSFPSEDLDILDIFAEKITAPSVTIGESPVYLVVPDLQLLSQTLKTALEVK